MKPHPRLDEALRHYRRGDAAPAIAEAEAVPREHPSFPTAMRVAASAHRQTGRLDLAVDAMRRLVEALPEPASWADLGVALEEAGQLPEALRCLRRAVEEAPATPRFHFDLGRVHARLREAEDACRAFGRALELDPTHHGALVNRGLMLGYLGAYPEARRHLERSLEIEPEHPAALFNLGLWHLLHGDLPAGWRGYRHRFRANRVPPRDLPGAPWDGSRLPPGKGLLVAVEQGLGDLLQFVRYLPMVAPLADRVALECPPSLAGLLRRSPGVSEIIPDSEAVRGDPGFAAHVHLLDLPALLGTTLPDVPRPVPYLFADPVRTTEWSARLDREAPGFRVGLVWAGNPAHENDRNRSIPLARLLPLAHVPGVRLLGLQLGPGRAQLPPVSDLLSVLDLGPALGDFDDTAAVMANLDLVISVDTSPVHLAGGMGLPTWILLPFNPDWRWLLDREDSPWYPTVRLFRQPRPGDWGPVVEAVRRSLAEAASPPLDVPAAKPAPLSGPRVAIVTPPVHAHSPLDDLGTFLVRSLLPPEARVVEVPLPEVERLEEAPVDLLLVGCGGALPVLEPPPALLRLVQRIPRSIGLFGVTGPYRSAARTGDALAALIAGLGAWLARTAEDTLLHGRGRSNVAWGGDWRLLAIPAAPTGEGDAVALEWHPSTSPEAGIARVQSFERVASPDADVLLCALSSASEIAWRGPDETASPPWDLRAVMLDVLGLSLVPGAWTSVDRASVASYRAQCAETFEQLRGIMQSLLPAVAEAPP